MNVLGLDIPDDWTVSYIRRHGEIVGATLVKGSELHCHRIKASGMWITRQDIERTIQPIIEKHGYCTTKVRQSNTIGHAFVRRLGFVVTHSDSDCIHYKCERLKHARL